MPPRLPIVVPHPAENTYELRRDYRLESHGVTVVAPKFFRFDGASIPAPAWMFAYTPFHPDVMLPSLIHDWMYYNHQESREVADDMFFTLLKDNGVSNFMANAMWGAVRAGGGFFWDNDEDDIDMLVALCRKVHRRPNFDGYKFPEDVIAQASRTGLAPAARSRRVRSAPTAASKDGAAG